MTPHPLDPELAALEAQGLRRNLRQVEAVDAGRIRLGGNWLVNLASNNYLGLTRHPKVCAAAQAALDQFGTGSGSARLLGGNFSPYEALEADLARFKQTEAALVFPTGYMANLGVVTSLVGSEDLVIGDRLNHASLIDAARLSRASFRVYPHRDVNRLEEILKFHAPRHRRTLVLTEGVFSMDGDLAPLPEIQQVCQAHGAWLMVDDAHGTGVLGEQGRGTVAHFGLNDVLQMGTLSKALGSVGGYLAGPQSVIELLKNKARSFIYTTALPPASLAAAHAALQVIQEEPIWLERLWENVQQVQSALQEAGWSLVSQESPILPIQVGSAEVTMALADALFAAGIYAPGIRPPTVPADSSRIRVSVTAAHTSEDLKRVSLAFREAALKQESHVLA